MSWEEYKAQRRGNAQNVQTASTTSTSSNSWEEYKRKKEEEEKERQRKLQQQSEKRENSRQQAIERMKKSERERQEQINARNTEIAEIQAKRDEENRKKKEKQEAIKSQIEQQYSKELKDIRKNISSNPIKQKSEVLPTAKTTSQPLKSTESLGEVIKYKKPANDAVASAINLYLGFKKGVLNSADAGVSAIESTYNDKSKMIDSMTSKLNEIREEEGLAPLPTAEEMKKSILGKNYTKDLFRRNKEEEQKRWDNIKKNIETNIALNIEGADTRIGKKMTEIIPSIGRQLPGYVLPDGIGLTYFTSSAKGAYLEDAKTRGMSEEDSNTYSGIMAITEGLTEQLGAGLTKGVGKNILKGNTKNALKLFGLDVAENFFEEAIMEPISETTATLTGGKETANWDNMGKRMLDSGINGGLSAIIMSGTSAGVGKAVQLTDKINNHQHFTKQEVSEAVKATLESGQVNQEELKNKIKENTNQIIKHEIENNLEMMNSQQEAQQDILEEQNNTSILENNVAETANNAGSYTKQQELLNNIENIQETLYNNNESESGINGEQEDNRNREYTDRRDTNEIQEGIMGSQEENAFSIDRYKQEETTIRQRGEVEYNDNDKTFAYKLKNKYNKKAFIYDDTNTSFGGGLSYIDSDTIMFGKNALNDYGYDFLEGHEILEDINKNHKDVSEEVINNLKEKLQEDDGFGDVFMKYLADMNDDVYQYYIDKPELIAKEIIGDLNGLRNANIDYRTLENFNSLKPEVVQEIQNEILNLENAIYSKENSNKSSFSVQQNVDSSIENNVLPTAKNNVAPSMENNILPVAENKASKEILLPKNFAKVNQELNNKENNEKTAELLGQLTNDKMTLKENKDLLVQKLVNKGHYIDQLAKITENKELVYKYDRMLGSSSEGQYEVGVAQTDNDGNKIGKSINDIWKPAENNNLVSEFSDYLLHKHNIDRMKQGKPVFGEEITSEVSKQMTENYEKLYPDFIEWSKDIYQFNKNQLKSTTEAGLTSEELEMLLDEMYSNYVTISRNKGSNTMDRNTKIVAPNRTIKRAVGGNTDIQPLKDSMAKQAIAVKQAIRRNDLGLELMSALRTAESVDTFDINNLLTQDKSGSYLIVFDKGQAKKVKITQGIYESLKPSQKYRIENTIPFKAIQKASSIQRSLLTVDNPIFMITNFFKDFQDGMFNSKYTSKFMKNYGKALLEIKNKGKYYNEYVANGGDSNTYFDYEKGVKKDTKISNFVDKIRKGNEIIEMAPRLSEYISTREAGGSVNEALYNAAEITTNFKRGGDIAKAINRNGANFLNASIQGLSKQIRNFSGQNGVKGYVNLLTKATALSVLPSVLNHLLLGDDEDYEDLPDYVKDTYYLFKIGNNKFLRIPKGRVLSIFGSAARRTLEYSEGNKDSFNGFIDTVKNQMAPNNPFSDNIFAPITQSLKNETWYGGDLVPTRLQDELPENQYDESTDNFSKWLGKLTGISPIKINYVIDQYSGGVGDILLPMMTPQAENNVLTDKFTIDSVLKNKNVSKFYETLDKQTKISNAPEATDENLLKTKYLNTIQASVSDLYKEKREIQLSSLSDKNKKEQVKKIQKEINDVLEYGLKEYNNGKIYTDHATIGDEAYYKVTNIKKGTKEWNKLSEEEKEKNKNISLKTYANYKENVVRKTISQRKNGTIKENNTIKDKDKIQILLDNNYSNKEKTALYENYILSSTDKKYPIIKETFTENGLNINKYLKYKSQEFSSDKKDDGTVDGKSISGSKKKKVWDYIENMNITYTQKLILYGLEYTPTNREQTQIVNYINSLPKTSQEKLEILDQFQGFTIYKNGTFKY